MRREVMTADDVRWRPRAPRAPVPGARPPAGEAPPRRRDEPVESDDFKSALLKLIPGETIGVYTALIALATAAAAADQPPDARLLALFLGFGILFNPIYLNRVAGVSKPLNLALSTIAFVVYVYAQGDWFRSAGLYVPVLGAALLVMAGALLPILAGVRPGQETAADAG